MSVRIGIGALTSPGHQGRGPFLEYLDTLESQNWDSIWFSDRIVGPVPRLDPIAAMAMVAAYTKKLRFGTGVLLMSMRSPVSTAHALATIDLISEGRLVVGVGIGQESNLEYDAMGVKKRDRGRRLDEAIHVMRRLFSEDTITYESDFLKIDDAGINPKPSHPDIPIWIGGRTEAAFRRTGFLGDGWLPSQVTPEEAAYGVDRINAFAKEAGREIPDDHFGLQIGSYIVEQGELPLEKISNFMLRRRSDIGLDELNLLGPPETVLNRMNQYIDAGITKFVLNPACDATELPHQLELQSQVLVEHFHKK
jgi:probable F420-dependent oxidoreductase